MTRVAALDCGTNSLRLLVADVDPAAGTLVDLDRAMEVVRLGQGVDATGELAPEALERTYAVLRRYAARIEELGAERVRMVATSASRDARNAREFTAAVRDLLGVAPEVVPGTEEAALSFDGATRDLRGARPGPYLVVDVGGGSTEFVLGSGEGAPSASVSVDVGCVRLTERHLHDDPPTPGQVAALRADVDAALDRAAAAVPLTGAATLCAVAGTATTLAAIALGLPAYDPDRIHLSAVGAGHLDRVTAELLAATVAQRTAIPVMHPGRADVIAAGALVLQAVLARLGASEMVVSEHDILDGVAWSLV